MTASFTLQTAQGQLADTANHTVYTAPNTANLIALLRSLVISNTSGTPATITVYGVPFGGSAGATNMLIPPTTIPANGGGNVLDEIVALGPQEFLVLKAGTGAVLNYRLTLAEEVSA